MPDAPSSRNEAALIAELSPEGTAVNPAPEATVPSTKRIPHMGHLGILAFLLAAGLLCTGIAIFAALFFHLFGVHDIKVAMHSMPYAIGTMVVWYGCAFAPAAAIFPMMWGKSFLAGLQWNAAKARQYWPRLMATGVGCFLIAVASRRLLHFPDKSPIAGMLTSQRAVWIMFVFAVTLAPLCEEILFRGFLLPAFCTACDWVAEKLTGRAPRALLEGGHPSWSVPAMVLGSILTSAIFAGFHAGQIGNSIGPVVLIFAVSLVLCAGRLATRSLAASTLMHATYNFTLFTAMAVGTHGFQNLPK